MSGTGEQIIKWSIVVLLALRGLATLVMIDAERKPIKTGPAIAAAVVQALLVAAVVTLWD